MRTFLLAIVYIIYLWQMIKMLINIEDFGDFIFFIFIGSTLLGIIHFVVTAIIFAITEGNE